MEQHTIRYLNDPLSDDPKELGVETEPSYERALDRVAEVMPLIRARHGLAAGYRIENSSGKTVITGPGMPGDA